MALVGLVAASAHAAPAEPAVREVHGAADAFALDGVAIAWALLRAANDDDAVVVVRIEPDPRRFLRIEVITRDPFSAGKRTLLAATDIGGPFDLRVPEKLFADYPRTEFRLWAKDDAAPALVVYYLGVPDTAPETTRADELDRSLEMRLARARDAAARSKP